MLFALLEQKSSHRPGTDVYSPTEPHVTQAAESSEFNSFQFWRTPLPNIEADLLELLVCMTVPNRTAVFFSRCHFAVIH